MLESYKIHTNWKLPEFSVFHKLKQLFAPEYLIQGKKNYFTYGFNKKEWMVLGGKNLGILLLFSYFFYQSIWAFFLLSPLWFYLMMKEQQTKGEQQRMELEQQFKEAMLAVLASLQAGYSLENAFMACQKDMVILFGEKSNIVEELGFISRGIRNHIPLEGMVLNLGQRSGSEEIKEFSDVFHIAKYSGGGITEILQKTISVIQEKMEIKEEIETTIHEKKLESQIMCVIPFFIIFYMNLTSPGYFQVLYHNFLGVIIMTVCMVLYVVGVTLAGKIAKISL